MTAATGRPSPSTRRCSSSHSAVGIPDALRWRLSRIVLRSSSLKLREINAVEVLRLRRGGSPVHLFGPHYLEPIAHPALHKRRADLETRITLVTVAAVVSEYVRGDETLPLPIIDAPSYRSSAGVISILAASAAEVRLRRDRYGKKRCCGSASLAKR